VAALPLAAQELFNYCDDSPTPGVPGAQLAREARSDIYAHNYAAAIPLLEKGVRLGNLDAMEYLFCYFYGHGVPLDRRKALQLDRTVKQAAYKRELRVDREQQEEHARSAREFERRIENAASSPSYRSAPTKPQEFKGQLVLTPWGLKARTPFTSTWDTTP
jgi:TPR repeat protein